MSGLIALALSIGGLGSIATWLALGPLAEIVTIWTIFIAWGVYFNNGADNDALKNTITCGIFGSVMAGIAALLVLNISLGAVTAPIWVGLTVFVLVAASQLPMLSAIPTSIYGYAATFAYLLEGRRLDMAHVAAVDLSNPVIVISLSIVAGAVFGMLSSKCSSMLSSE